MKLYTEEQVRRAIELSRNTHQEGKPYLERDEYDYSIDEVVDMLKPIELPSDEEIKTYLNNHSYEFEHGFKDAIEFMKNKIQGGNNEQQ